MTPNFNMIAKTLQGLEEVLAGELENIGAENIKIVKRAVTFTGDLAVLYKANYLCRSAIAILRVLTVCKITTQEDLYKEISKISWESILDVDGTFCVEAVVSNTVFTHSHYVSLKIKDAVADRFRRLYNKRPNVDTENPDIFISVHLYEETCTISLNSSGKSLHKRGYRKQTDVAPINEVLAAGIILLSGWDKNSHFIDPMCGSGTFLIEAAMIANNIPAGYYRKSFGFQRWKNYDADLWENIKKEALLEQTEFEGQIVGSDISPVCIDMAYQNILSAKFHKDIELHVQDVEKQIPPKGKGIMICNPPYGERICPDDIFALYQGIGNALKHNYAGYTAWVICADNDAIKHIGLRPSKKINMFNGALACKLLKFEIYEGSKKAKYQQDQ